MSTATRPIRFRNIFRAHANRAKQNPQATSSAPIGTLADFLDVEGQYESVVDEFLREELNYIVMRNWQDADNSVQLLQKEVAAARRSSSPTPSWHPANVKAIRFAALKAWWRCASASASRGQRGYRTSPP